MNPKNTAIKIKLGALLITIIIVQFYPLKILAWLIIGLVAFLEYRNALALSLSLLFTTVILALILEITVLKNIMYYRPFEMLQSYNSEADLELFKKKQHIEMLMPFGDLYAMDRKKDIDPEPRKVIYRTDSSGFRNESDYSGEKYLLVGDSCIVGEGNTQEDILSAQLKKYGIAAYSAAYPGGVPDYASYISYFQKRHGSNSRALLFIFEGNDFPAAYGTGKKSYNKFWAQFRKYKKEYKAFFKESPVYRFTYSLYHKFMSQFKKKRLDETVILNFDNHKIGFLKSYIDVTKRTDYKFQHEVAQKLKTVGDGIEHIFFIPEKYRVLSSLRNDPDKLPSAQWEAVKILSSELGIKSTDLTPYLIEESKNLYKTGRFVFWKDDTHWNKYGINVAARVIYDKIKSGEIK